jgi:hypothetical protein
MHVSKQEGKDIIYSKMMFLCNVDMWWYLASIRWLYDNCVVIYVQLNFYVIRVISID